MLQCVSCNCISKAYSLTSSLLPCTRHVGGVEQLCCRCYRAGPNAAARDHPQSAGPHRVGRAGSRGRLPLAHLGGAFVQRRPRRRVAPVAARSTWPLPSRSPLGLPFNLHARPPVGCSSWWTADAVGMACGSSYCPAGCTAGGTSSHLQDLQHALKETLTTTKRLAATTRSFGEAHWSSCGTS